MFDLKILQPAWNDLERIADMHMSMVGSNSAKKFTEEILDKIETLSMFPMAYPFVPDEELAELGYRMMVYKKYLVIYRTIENTVFIYHIADGRGNYPQLIKGIV